MCTTPTNFIYLPLKTPPLYTYVGKRRVMSDLEVIPQMDPSPAPIMMANTHRFDDIVHISIRLRTGNHKYTVCINSLRIPQAHLSIKIWSLNMYAADNKSPTQLHAKWMNAYAFGWGIISTLDGCAPSIYMYSTDDAWTQILYIYICLTILICVS